MLNKINFKNKNFSKKALKEVVYEAFTNFGIEKTTKLSDEMKEVGFHYATQAGISLSIEDLKEPNDLKIATINNTVCRNI